MKISILGTFFFCAMNLQGQTLLSADHSLGVETAGTAETEFIDCRTNLELGLPGNGESCMTIHRFGNGHRSFVLMGGIHGDAECITTLMMEELLVLFKERKILPRANARVYLIPHIDHTSKCPEPNPLSLSNEVLKKNPQGINLNRNWKTKSWREVPQKSIGQETDPHAVGYPNSGKFPEEASEVRNLAAWLVNLKEKDKLSPIVISYHSRVAGGFVQASYKYVPEFDLNAFSPGESLVNSEIEKIFALDPRAAAIARLYADTILYGYYKTYYWEFITGEFLNWCGENSMICLDVELPDANFDNIAQHLNKNIQALSALFGRADGEHVNQLESDHNAKIDCQNPVVELIDPDMQVNGKINLRGAPGTGGVPVLAQYESGMQFPFLRHVTSENGDTWMHLLLSGNQPAYVHGRYGKVICNG